LRGGTGFLVSALKISVYTAGSVGDYDFVADDVELAFTNRNRRYQKIGN
jgi:tRNA A58 N-methylase Trm61